MLRPRRRSRFGPHLCAVAAALLLFLSVILLYSRLSSDSTRQKRRPLPRSDAAAGALDDPFADDPLLRDSDPDLTGTTKSFTAEDRIDELDVVEDDPASRISDEGEILRGVESEEEEEGRQLLSKGSSSSNSNCRGCYFDHVAGAIRRAFDKKSIDEIDGWDDYTAAFDVGLASDEDRSKIAFGSDDMPVDEDVRRKMVEVKGVEDALLLKIGSRVSPLREGWGSWFDAKNDFLKKDKMFKSNFEALNPLNHPLLQDPDAAGVSGLTRGDKIVLKGLLNQFKKVPFLGKKPLGLSTHKSGKIADFNHTEKLNHSNDNALSKQSFVEKSAHENNVGSKSKIKGVERKALNENPDHKSGNRKMGEMYNTKRISGEDKVEERHNIKGADIIESSHGISNQVPSLNYADSNPQSKYDSSESVYADGRRWGYFPGLHPHLSFSNFMDAFFRRGKCSMRVFMVWNSPPWKYGIRHQRGLESLLFHHPDACVVVFSETLELNFFKEFTEDGFKVATAMPNLEELLKDTPTNLFASAWHEWRSTKYYSTHYSELVRLAALYKYGGIYLDCDIIVLRLLSSLSNTAGMEDAQGDSPLNGAVMSFRKHSRFIGHCLEEFYASYDDTLLRWNGAELLTRVAGNFSSREDASSKELHVQHSSIFFPVSSHLIARYFKTPATDGQRAVEDAMFQKILNESYTFHFWDSVTSSLVPEPGSLVARVINHRCIRCLDTL